MGASALPLAHWQSAQKLRRSRRGRSTLVNGAGKATRSATLPLNFDSWQNQGVNFVTIHDLSRELNVPARVIRYRFHQLRLAGKLAEGDDFKREDYVDEQHFTWLINPLAYMRETGKGIAPPPVGIPIPEMLRATGHPLGNQTVNMPPPMVNQADTKPTPSVTESQPVGIRTAAEPPVPSLEREMIEFLKEQIGEKDDQIHTKDDQIKSLSSQLKEASDLNVRLVGQNVHQANQIQELLKLASGSPSSDRTVTTFGSHDEDVVNDMVNQDDEPDNNIVTSMDADGCQAPQPLDEQGSEAAA